MIKTKPIYANKCWVVRVDGMRVQFRDKENAEYYARMLVNQEALLTI